MLQLKILSCLICLLGLVGPLYAADKYTDENRPYEFGFTIDGEQHRHEKKDENGIIMGEFGFITADGVYHVTVYATDENGRFKILSMKNIRVKPYPTAGGGVKKGHSIPFPPSKNTPVVEGPSPSKTLSPEKESKSVQINKQIASPAKSCSHCSLPTTTTRAPPPQLTDLAIVSKDNHVPVTAEVNNFKQQETGIGKSFPASNSGYQSNPQSPRINQYNSQNQQANSNQNPFDIKGQNNRQQGFSGNPKFPSSEDNLNYPGQSYNENVNIPQTNQYNLQNRDNSDQNYPQVGNSGLQSNPPNRNNGDQYYSQEDTYKSPNNPEAGVNANQYYPQEEIYTSPNNPPKELDANQNYPREQVKANNNYVPPGATSIQSQPEQDFIEKSQPPKDILRTPKQYNDIPTPNFGAGQSQFGTALAAQDYPPVSNKPTLLAAQMQIVPKDTNIHHRNPGEEEGLPDGLSKDDMTHLLYTFNYTVGFHGHQEEGYSNGAKKGYYYVTGRNGVRTRIDYIADEKGFRPRISQEVLDLLSDDVPKPETEKDEKFGLKGYEFKWIYYPKDEKK